MDIERDNSFVFAESFGFCGGVAAADALMADTARIAKAHGVPVFGYHEIVHNKGVVAAHQDAGVEFVDDIDRIDVDSVAVLSAHGVSPEVYKKLEDKGCVVVDATCPLVVHTHKGAELARQNGEKVIYVCHREEGKPLHDEVLGTIGHLDWRQTRSDSGSLSIDYDPVNRTLLELDEDPDLSELLDESAKYRIITQTTLDADGCLIYREVLKDKILAAQPNAVVHWANKGDVCRAVSDRQKSVEQIVELKPRRLVVVTDPGSKNGMGYVRHAGRLAAERGYDTEVVAISDQQQAELLAPADGLTAITASASTPDSTIKLVSEVLGATNVPESQDGVFRLRDAAEGVLERKIASLALRRG
jgi:4-hydroxy-3-methylbut-2-en-1-yl diphosphate reductase